MQSGTTIQGIGLLGAIFVAFGVLSAAIAGDRNKLINAGDDHVAVRGYDVVAYFTEGKPMQGKAEFAFKWRDVIWQFSSAKHKDVFAADPQRYAPQFGGFCAMAMTNGIKMVVDPNAWTIVDNRLYLNFSLKGRGIFRQDLTGNIAKSEGHWARLNNEQ